MPGATVVARPAALMVAISVAEELQVAELRLRVLPSPKVPVAVNCTVAATAIEGFAGVTAMDVSLFADVMLEHDNMDIAVAIPAIHQKTGIA